MPGALIEQRDFEGAIALLTKVIAAHPNSAKAYELRGLSNQEEKLFESAIQDYTGGPASSTLPMRMLCISGAASATCN